MSTITRWDYLTLETSVNYGTTKYYLNGDMKVELKNSPLHQVLNQIGAQGWELVGISQVKEGSVYILKRPSMRPAGQAQPQKTATPSAPKPTEG